MLSHVTLSCCAYILAIVIRVEKMKKYSDLAITIFGTLAVSLVFMPQAQALSWEQASDAHSIIIVKPAPKNGGSHEGDDKDRLSKFKFERESLRSNESEHHVRDDSQVPVVPEPETYAMMLAGLGLMVITLSRRKKNTFN